MKGVFRTKAGKHEVRWREGSRQRSKTFTRERDATSFKREVDRQIELGRPVLLRRDVPTLSSFADEWLERRQVRGEISLNTALFIATLRDKHIDPFIGHLCLLDLTAIRLDQWQSECLAAGSPYMTQRASQLLAQILDSAVRKGYLVGGNPARSLERIPHTHAEGIALHPRQVEQIRAWFLAKKRLGDATLVSVIAYAGPRTEEAWAMRWRNLRGRRYFVEEKNVDGRLVPDPKTGHRWIDLPEAVVADLAEWRLASGRPEGLIFPKRDGRPWSKSDRGNWRRRWLRRAAEGVAPSLTPRDLRHTCASLLAATNTPRIEIENQLGHRADTSERIYQHLIDELRGTKLGVDALIAQARTEVFREDADVRREFGGQQG